MTDFVSFDRLCDAIKELGNRRALVTFHSIGDRDGVASAIAISKCFEDSIIATPDFLTNNAKRMLKQADYKKEIVSNFPEDREVVIITDANNLELMGPFKEELMKFDDTIIFIDHHAISDYKLDKKIMTFNDEGYNSASSIVYDLLKRNEVEMTRDTALLLLNGIISDSADFQNTTPITFKQVSELLETAEISYADISEYFHQDISGEDRYRLMKTIFAAKTELIGDYILMYGPSESFANIAAQTAIDFGADASVFWVERENEVSISARLRPPLDRRLGIHLGRILQESGRELGGSGGGHPCAAGAYGKNKEALDNATQPIIDTIKERFSGQ